MRARRLRIALLVALAAATLVSCRKPITVNLGQPFDLVVGGAARFRSSDLDLYFRRVSEDSRCPRGVECIRAGDAVVTLDGRILKGPPESFTVRLPGGAVPDSAIDTAYDGYRIRLLRLEPYPVSGTPVDTTRYVATLQVEKR